MLNAHHKRQGEPQILTRLCELFRVVGQKSSDRCVQLVTALQEVEFEDEEEADQISTQVLDELSCRTCRSTCCTTLAQNVILLLLLLLFL